MAKWQPCGASRPCAANNQLRRAVCHAWDEQRTIGTSYTPYFHTYYAKKLTLKVTGTPLTKNTFSQGPAHTLPRPLAPRPGSFKRNLLF